MNVLYPGLAERGGAKFHVSLVKSKITNGNKKRKERKHNILVESNLFSITLDVVLYESELYYLINDNYCRSIECNIFILLIKPLHER